jgi:hypothetical protein
MIIVQAPVDVILSSIEVNLRKNGMDQNNIKLAMARKFIVGLLSTGWAWYSIATEPLIPGTEIRLAEIFLINVTVIKTFSSFCFLFCAFPQYTRKMHAQVTDQSS